MRIFVAGASGAIGNRLVAMLVERGHEVSSGGPQAHCTGARAALPPQPPIVQTSPSSSQTVPSGSRRASAWRGSANRPSSCIQVQASEASGADHR